MYIPYIYSVYSIYFDVVSLIFTFEMLFDHSRKKRKVFPFLMIMFWYMPDEIYQQKSWRQLNTTKWLVD